MTNDLLQALEASDAAGASKLFGAKMANGEDAWEIHLSLFPAVQRVLNPPFINPHLPKMYRICQEFIPYLRKEEIPALVSLEITEYAKRPKLEKLPKAKLLTSPVSFTEVESAISEKDWEKTAVLMAALYAREGGAELARQLLLLGSGYLNQSLGHSVSCTAFIVSEMVDRADQDPWPALSALADYFCKGWFHITPTLQKKAVASSDKAFQHHLLRATTGRGVVNLHHTITLYAIERSRRFLNNEEYTHMINAWINFMQDKKAEQEVVKSLEVQPAAADYNSFFETFSRLETEAVMKSLGGMLVSRTGRQQLGSFLIKALCDHYQGNYNPHYLTGLGSTLWIVAQYLDQAPIIINALFQYLDFLFSGLKREN